MSRGDCDYGPEQKAVFFQIIIGRLSRVKKREKFMVMIEVFPEKLFHSIWNQDYVLETDNLSCIWASTSEV